MAHLDFISGRRGDLLKQHGLHPDLVYKMIYS